MNDSYMHDYYNCYIISIQMKSREPKIMKNPSNASLASNRSTSKLGLLGKPGIISKPSVSPSNARIIPKQITPTPMSKERNSSIANKSSFKLYIGKHNESKKKEIDIKQDQKENVHPNFNSSKIIYQKQKGKTLKEVRLGISKPDNNSIKDTLKSGNNYSQAKKDSKLILIQSSQEQSMLKYIPKEIVDDYKKVTLEDFIIIRQIEELQCSNEYLALHKRLNFIFTIKKFNKNLVIEQELFDQLTQSIKIHFYISQQMTGHSIQKLFMIFHDSTSVFLVLQPTIGTSIKQDKSFSMNSHEQTIGNFGKVIQTIAQLHKNNMILRNLSLNSIKNEMGVMKITNIITSATFSAKRRRQSFLGSLTEAPHEVTIGQSYDNCYDMWSLGLIFYEIIMNFRPFQGEYAMTLIKNLDFKLPISIKNELACLLSSLLCEKSKRLSALQCLCLTIFSKQSREGHMVSRDIYNFWSNQ